MGKVIVWPAEHEDHLIRLNAAGLSGSAIADRLNEAFGTNYSRSAVIGKKKRLALAPPPVQRRRSIEAVDLGEPHFVAIPLMRRARHQCAWPVNDGKPYLFCGLAKTDPNSSYCARHHQLGVNRREPRLAPQLS